MAYEAQKNYPDRDLSITAYGSPLVSLPGDPSGKDRMRHVGDPICMLDRGAQSSVNIGSNWYNPHSFLNFQNNNKFRSNAIFDPNYSASR